MIHHFPPFSLLNILPEKEDVTNKKSVKQHLKKTNQGPQNPFPETRVQLQNL